MSRDLELEELKNIIHLMVLPEINIIQEDGRDEFHALEVSYDGDGWNEPYSECYECACAQWEITWIQYDRDCSGSPDVIEVAKSWAKHVKEKLGD